MQVVLVNPQIPQNTGSIARTCAATKIPLCIVGKPAFEINDKNVRRAGLDYWPYVDLRLYKTWDDYLSEENPNTLWYLTKFAKRPYYEAEFQDGHALVFGSETTGLGQEFLSQHPENSKLLIPMLEEGVRSLNLSNCVSLVLYDALRQISRI